MSTIFKNVINKSVIFNLIKFPTCLKKYAKFTFRLRELTLKYVFISVLFLIENTNLDLFQSFKSKFIVFSFQCKKEFNNHNSRLLLINYDM